MVGILRTACIYLYPIAAVLHLLCIVFCVFIIHRFKEYCFKIFKYFYTIKLNLKQSFQMYKVKLNNSSILSLVNFCRCSQAYKY